MYSISLYVSQVELYSLDSGHRTRTRLCTGESSSTNTGHRHVFISVKSHPSHTKLMSCFFLYRGTGSTAIYPLLGCKLEPEWEFVATGTFYSPLNQIKRLRGTLELDDVSYECASGNVSTNNMESRIRLEKATREGSILFILEGNLESKFVNLYIRTPIPHLFIYF